MSAAAEMEVETALWHARHARLELGGAVAREREWTVAYMDRALAAGWPWERIGTALGISATGARRYYDRNRRRLANV